MILGGEEIRRRVREGALVIVPFREDAVGPNSYDVHLKDQLFQYAPKFDVSPDGDDATRLTLRPYIDPDDVPELISVPKDDARGGWILQPGILYLGCTEEYTETRDLVPMIDGRSSIGRLGVSVHATAGRGDVGFCGNWTLEISVVHPVLLRPGMRIGQLWYLTIDGDYVAYHGRYQDSRATVASRYGRKGGER